MHTAFESLHTGKLDANWAGYPDIYAALGFLQYVVFPTAFYSVLHPQNEQLYTPIASTEELLFFIEESTSTEKEAMRSLLAELNAFWEMEPFALSRALPAFCERFSAHFSSPHMRFYVRIFKNTYEVARYIEAAVWAEDVFEEDFRITMLEFRQWCKRFYSEPFARLSFLKFLNERVGLLV